jgi:hypothetical protein
VQALFLVVVIVVLWLVARRAAELCAIRVDGGRAHLLRGRAPARFVSDVDDIAARAKLSGLTLRVVLDGGAPRWVLPEAVPAAVVQQLRNALGQHQVLHFRSGRRAGGTR